MEDSSIHLDFDADNFKFYIKQEGKEPYTFQNLSSGYSSIFSVFSKLLMRSEYLKVSPSKLCGVAIIDDNRRSSARYITTKNIAFSI